MDLKKVRFVAVGVAVVAGGAGLYVMTRPDAAPEQQAAPPPTPAEVAEMERKKAFSERAAKYLARQAARPKVEEPKQIFPLRDLDRAVLRLLEEKPPQAHADDVLPGQAKVDVTILHDRTSGRIVPRYVNIDLNRDERYDEHWTLGDKIQRQARPIDDRRGWQDTFELESDQWTLRHGRGETAAQQPAPPPEGLALRDLDRRLLKMAKTGGGLSGPEVKDATPGEPHQVKVLLYPTGKSIRRLSIDLDRDRKWDEEWLFARETVKRSVSPEDNGQFTETYTLRKNQWYRL